MRKSGLCQCSEYQYKGNAICFGHPENGIVATIDNPFVCWKCLNERKEPDNFHKSIKEE